MKRAGKRTLAWERVRRSLKPKFEAAGITRCEFNFHGCWRNDGLSFAHVDKRRFLKEEDLDKAALACLPCHNTLEIMQRDSMRAEIESVIRRREIQP